MNRVKVVINGCFDLLHAGHIKIIHIALLHAQAGELLVLVNSDSSVKKLKGDDRPYNNFTVRKTEIKKVINIWSQKYLEYPDTYVESFDSELELECSINTFKPDMIIKGDDRPDTRDIVGSGNWPILIVPRLADKDGDVISTTNIAKRRIKE